MSENALGILEELNVTELVYLIKTNELEQKDTSQHKFNKDLYLELK